MTSVFAKAQALKKQTKIAWNPCPAEFSGPFERSVCTLKARIAVKNMENCRKTSA